MKGLMVPLLVMWATGIVVGQQTTPNTNSGFSQLVGNRFDRPTPDDPVLPAGDPASTTTRQTPGAAWTAPASFGRQLPGDPGVRYEIKIGADVVEQMRQGNKMETRFQNSQTGGLLPSASIGEVALFLSSNVDFASSASLAVVPIRPVSAFDQTLRFELSEYELAALSTKQLVYEIAESDRGKYVQMEFTAAPPENRGGTSNQVFPSFGPGPVDFVGPVNQRSPSGSPFGAGGLSSPANSNSVLPSANNNFSTQGAPQPWLDAATRPGQPVANGLTQQQRDLQERERQIAEREARQDQLRRDLEIEKWNSERRARELDEQQQRSAQPRLASRELDNMAPIRSMAGGSPVGFGSTSGVTTDQVQANWNSLQLIKAQLDQRQIAQDQKESQLVQLAQNLQDRTAFGQPFSGNGASQAGGLGPPSTLNPPSFDSSPYPRVAERRPSLDNLDNDSGAPTNSVQSRTRLASAPNGPITGPPGAGFGSEDKTPAKANGREMGAIYLLLLISLGLNAYLGLLCRSFYFRYNELSEELRETFTASV